MSPATIIIRANSFTANSGETICSNTSVQTTASKDSAFTGIFTMSLTISIRDVPHILVSRISDGVNNAFFFLKQQSPHTDKNLAPHTAHTSRIVCSCIAQHLHPKLLFLQVTPPNAILSISYAYDKEIYSKN